MDKPVRIQAPASKSMSHRALIASALAPGASEVSGLLESRDIRRTLGCLAAMGAEFGSVGSALMVEGMPKGPRGGGREPADLFMEESGTTCRLVTGVAGAGHGAFRVHGSGRMHDRPIADLTDVLEGQGAFFDWQGSPGYPPFVMHAKGLRGGEMSVSLEQSSQYLSGLLLAAPLAADPVALGVSGSKIVSWPYVALTLQIMEDFGVAVRVQTRGREGWADADYRDPGRVEPGKVRFLVPRAAYKARSYRVEGDWSNASYFLAAGAVGPRPVRMAGFRRDSLQGDRAILDILSAMGAGVSWEGDEVTVAPGELRGVDLDMGPSPDIVPTVAVVAALARGETRITNVAHLRIKESDRLAALGSEVSRLGAGVELLEDGLVVRPGTVPAGKRIEYDTYADHRIAMCMAVSALAGVEPVPDNPGCVAKSFPEFWDKWLALLAECKESA